MVAPTLLLGAFTALTAQVILAAPQDLPNPPAEAPGLPIQRRWFVDWASAARVAMYCPFPSANMSNFGPSHDAQLPLYDDCWNMGIDLSENPGNFSFGDFAGTNGCGKVKTNGTCGICVGRTDGKNGSVLVGSEDVANALIPVAEIYLGAGSNVTGGTAKMACPDANLLWQVRHVKYMGQP